MSRRSFDNETLEAIGQRIREARGERTQREFAQELGIDRTTLANYEAGKRLPNDVILKKISELSGISVPVLLTGMQESPVRQFQNHIEARIRQLSVDEPGFIPKWYISDDEISLIIAVRLARHSGDPFPLIAEIVKMASETVEITRNMKGTRVPYGEGHIDRLNKILNAHEMKHGYDPDYMLFSPLWSAFNDKKSD